MKKLLLMIASLLSVVVLCSCSHSGPSAEIGDVSNASPAMGTTLPVVSSSDPAVAQAVNAEDIGTLSNDSGSIATVAGTLTNIIYPPHAGANMVLWFHPDKIPSANIVVQAADVAKLPDLRSYIGKKLLVKGSVFMAPRLPVVTLDAASDLKQVQ